MKPDYRRIHQLEYELGFRGDAPSPAFTDEPGAVIPYRPPVRRTTTIYSIVQDVWTCDRLVACGCPPGTRLEQHGEALVLRSGDWVTWVRLELASLPLDAKGAVAALDALVDTAIGDHVAKLQEHAA